MSQTQPTARIPTLDQALDPHYWHALNPHLAVPDAPIVPPTFHPTDPVAAPDLDLLRHEGYLQLPNQFPVTAVPPLVEGILNLVRHEIPPVFIYAYTECQQLLQHSHPTIRSILGDGYFQLPQFWAWHVDPKNEEAGWAPHRDYDGPDCLLPDGSPVTLTLWIPLSEATPLNGCMYLVPAHLDPDYPGGQGTSERKLSAIRALPAKPGEALIWNSRVLHWGSQASPRAAGPRISLSVEFQRADHPCQADAPLPPQASPLPFEDRMAFIAKQILAYWHLYSFTFDLLRLAKKLSRPPYQD